MGRRSSGRRLEARHRRGRTHTRIRTYHTQSRQQHDTQTTGRGKARPPDLLFSPFCKPVSRLAGPLAALPTRWLGWPHHEDVGVQHWPSRLEVVLQLLPAGVEGQIANVHAATHRHGAAGRHAARQGGGGGVCLGGATSAGQAAAQQQGRPRPMRRGSRRIAGVKESEPALGRLPADALAGPCGCARVAGQGRPPSSP